jgi:hypothetical protein
MVLEHCPVTAQYCPVPDTILLHRGEQKQPTFSTKPVFLLWLSICYTFTGEIE